jgi:excisionase family DNA binding protein
VRDVRHDRTVANEQSGGTRPRPGMSAWLALGLALGWLAVLATFVRGVGSLLTTWAASVALAVLVVRRRPAAPVTVTSDHAVSPTRPATPSSEVSASRTDPPVSGGIAEIGQSGSAGKSAESVESAEEENEPGSAGHQVDVTEAPGSSTTGTPESYAAVRTATQPALPSVPAAETAIVRGLQVLTAAEVALVLRVDVEAIILAIGNGELPGNRIGSHWRVDQEALVRWLLGSYRSPVT